MTANEAGAKERRNRRAKRRAARQTHYARNYRAAINPQQRLEKAWDWLRAVVARADEAIVMEAADEIRRLAERLDERNRR